MVDEFDNAFKPMSNLRLTKRDFLKYGTSLMTAAALPYPYQAALAKEQWDAIVIGAGTAGSG